jgi:cytosine/adenosine deaminase-related metal-dependent hydrolase
MKILIKAGWVCPVTSPPIKNGFVLVNGGLIEAVGERKEAGAHEYERELDFSGRVLLPGFVNAHSHLELSGLRGRRYGGSFIEWIETVINHTSHTSPAVRRKNMEMGIREMAASGITAVGDIVSTAEMAAPLLASSMKSVLFAEAIAPLPSEAESTADNVERELEKIHSLGGRGGISPHAPHTVSERLFIRLKKTAGERAVPFTTHLAETKEEVEYIRDGRGPLRDFLEKRGRLPDGFEGTGESPVSFLNQCSVLGGTLAVHLNRLEEGDVELLSSAGAVPVFCPGSSKWFGRERLLPLEELLEAGLKPAIGTDSLASNSSLSMLDELRTAAGYFPKIPREIFIRMATVNGARALGINGGAIEKGKAADLIAFRMTGSRDPFDALFSAEKADFVLISRQ